MKNFVLLAVLSFAVSARTITSDQFIIWGIGDNQIVIPSGGVITEAVLTIVGVSGTVSGLSIHLLDDTNSGLEVGTDLSGQNFFSGFGVPLSGDSVSGNYVCTFSKNNDAASSIWSVFSSPSVVQLADLSSVQMTSSLLWLNDYAGSGRGFGIGIDPGNASFSFRSMTLVLTIKNYQGAVLTSKLTYRIK